MDNPFLRRATEQLRDEEAFLSIVSPAPVEYFLGRAGERDLLYDRLVYVTGTPGSGKTTLARLFEYPTLTALLRNKNLEAHSGLVKVMLTCKALEDKRPLVIGCRLPMESDYRDFWEFSYDDSLKIGLMCSLIQARAVLSWMRNLQSAAIPLEDIAIVPQKSAVASLEQIGGTTGPEIVERARSMEKLLYGITGALVPPDVASLPAEVRAAYEPFSVIEFFRVQVSLPDSVGKTEILLRPLVMLDDAWALHPSQFDGLQRWLKSREMRVARWILTRLDVLHPRDALQIIATEEAGEVQLPGITTTREITHIMMFQGQGDNRDKGRSEFRKMAKDMARRYLRSMALFNDKGLTQLGSMLQTTDIPLGKNECDKIYRNIEKSQKILEISADERRQLEEQVQAYTNSNHDIAQDLQLQMLLILMNRYNKRRPALNMTMDFDMETGIAEVKGDSRTKIPKVTLGVLDAARIQLMHLYNRPYYFGIDTLCDASSENAEQFLHLAAVLVEDIATRIIRARDSSLDAKTQHNRLRENARSTVEHWSFAQSSQVRRLTSKIAELCLSKTLEHNAPLDHGANAYGISQQEFDAIPEKYPDLARVLQSAVAHNALSITPKYSCKGKEWCLLELGGMVILQHGLPLKRGGFIEGSVSFLDEQLAEGNV